MGNGNQIGPKDADQACRLIAEGKTLSETATIIGRSTNGLHKALKESWPDEYLDAKQRRDDVIRNKIWTLGLEQQADAATQRWALDHLIKWHLPEARETQRLEISGDKDKPILVTHQRGLTLADLIHDPRAARLVEQASRELPAAGEVLAELERGVDPASDLPARPKP